MDVSCTVCDDVPAIISIVVLDVIAIVVGGTCIMLWVVVTTSDIDVDEPVVGTFAVTVVVGVVVGGMSVDDVITMVDKVDVDNVVGDNGGVVVVVAEEHAGARVAQTHMAGRFAGHNLSSVNVNKMEMKVQTYQTISIGDGLKIAEIIVREGRETMQVSPNIEVCQLCDRCGNRIGQPVSVQIQVNE
jgi:hypothetical protein